MPTCRLYLIDALVGVPFLDDLACFFPLRRFIRCLGRSNYLGDLQQSSRASSESRLRRGVSKSEFPALEKTNEPKT